MKKRDFERQLRRRLRAAGQRLSQEALDQAWARHSARQRLCLLGASGWRYYSRRAGVWRAEIAYLCGRDDGGDFAVRVPGNTCDVLDALTWLEPSEVFWARVRRRTVLRQGDVYVVQMCRDRTDATVAALPPGHTWDPQTRILSHGEHAALHVPFAAKFIAQRAYPMGRGARGGRRGAAD